jgi:hypothetical protein
MIWQYGCLKLTFTQVQSSSSSNQQPGPLMTTFPLAPPPKDPNTHQHASKDAGVRPRHRMISEGRPSSSMRPPPVQPVEKIRKSSSGESSRQKRIIESESEDEDV